MKYNNIRKFIADLQNHNNSQIKGLANDIHYIQNFAAIIVFNCHLTKEDIRHYQHEDAVIFHYTNSEKAILIIILSNKYIQYINEKFAIIYEKKIDKLNIPQLVQNSDLTIDILKQILDYSGTGLCADMFYESKLNEMISLIIHENHLKTNSLMRPSTLNPEDIAVILDVAKYIDTHLDRNLKLEHLASMACMSTSKLKYSFKAVYNLTIRDYKTQKKFQAACHMLSHTRKNISEIAHLLGYKKTSAFTEMFKKYSGLTPRQYRK